MPVSRKRKKKRSGKPSTSPAPTSSALPGSAAQLVEQMFVQRAELQASRIERARPIADKLVAELATSAAADDVAREDELCARLGPILYDLSDGSSVEHYVSPETFAEVLVDRVIAAVRAALTGGADPVPAWRVLAAVTRVVPYGLAAAAFKNLPTVADLPPLPGAPEPAEVRWARDRYGSRIGVVAAFPAGETQRWYLWDIDACTYRPFTVHSGFCGSAEQAIEEWRTGVGPFASDGTRWEPVGEPDMLVEVLPRLEGLLEVGGESAAQFAEYYRCRRLSYAVLESLPEGGGVPEVDHQQVAEEFLAWLGERGTATTPALREVAAELAESWTSEVPSLYFTCSPHRVAHTVAHLRNYYLGDFAEELIALLPEWITWLAARTGAAPELVERCLLLARGEKGPAEYHEDSEPQARVIE